MTPQSTLRLRLNRHISSALPHPNFQYSNAIFNMSPISRMSSKEIAEWRRCDLASWQLAIGNLAMWQFGDISAPS
jgi:hypothetical protein